MNNCKQTNIPKVDNSDNNCCFTATDECITTTNALPTIGTSAGETLESVLSELDTYIADIQAGVVSWGSITGDINDQTDLINLFDTKANDDEVVKSVNFILPDAIGNVDIPTPTGLEAIDEGNGTGFRIIGRNPDNYLNTGLQAVDLSYSFTSGPERGASGQFSNISGGSNNTASGGYSSLGGGTENTVPGDNATISGGSVNTASGNFSTISGGTQNNASSIYSSILGGLNNIASGDASSVFGGVSNKARSYVELAGGVFGTDYTPNSTTDSHPEDRIFNIGNGSFLTNSDAFTILKNAQVGIDIDNFEANTTGEKLQVNGLIKSDVTTAEIGAGSPKTVITKEYADATYAGGSGSGTWGSITGTLSDQTDLQTELDNRVTLDTAETIAGQKTYEAWTIHNKGIIINGSTNDPISSGIGLDLWGLEDLHISFANKDGFIFSFEDSLDASETAILFRGIDGTVALLSDIVPQTLQQVLDTGNTFESTGTSNGIEGVNSGSGSGIYIETTAAGDSILSNATGTATGTHFRGRKEGITTFAVDTNGAIFSDADAQIEGSVNIAGTFNGSAISVSGVVQSDSVQTNLVDTGNIIGGTAQFSGIVKGITPVAPEDLATKQYVDSKTSSISNITTLKTQEGEIGQVVEVLGYYNKGDGGGGLFYWDEASTEQDDGGTIFEVTGTTLGRWYRVITGEIYARYFGMVADGISDDTEGINRMLSYSENNLVNINLESLVYGYTGKITIGTGVKLNNGVLKSLTTYKDSLAFSSVVDILGSNIIFENLTFDFNFVNNYGVDIKASSSDILFNNVNIINLKEIDGVTGYATKALNIHNGVVNFTYMGGLINDVEPFENNVPGDTQGASRGIQIGEVENCLIERVEFREIKGWEDGDCIHVATVLNGTKWSKTDVTIRDCVFIDFYKSAIKLQASGVRLVGNYISSDITGGSTNYPVAGIRSYGDDNSIISNIIKLEEGVCCISLGAQGEISNNIINNNLLYINKDNNSAIPRRYHIYFTQPVVNSTINNNELHGYGGIGFTGFQKLDNCTFDFNKFYNCKFDGYYSADSTRYLRDISISYNNFYHPEGGDGTNGDIWLSNPDGVICKYNNSFNSERNFVVLGDVGVKKTKLLEHINIDFKGTVKITQSISSGQENLVYIEEDTGEPDPVEPIKYLSVVDEGVDIENVSGLNVDNVSKSCILFSDSFSGTLPLNVTEGYVQTFTFLNSAVQIILSHTLSTMFFRRKSLGVWSNWINLSNSVSGTFTTSDGKNITVENGLISEIV